MAESIDYEIFREWVKQHFKELREKNGKIRLNSIYCDAIGGDRKFHLYCKPVIGMFKCMKSGEKGSLYALVMQVESCSYDQAVDILQGEHNLRYFEAKLDDYLNPESNESKTQYTGWKKKLDFPPNTFRINTLGENNHFRMRAEQYLTGRKLPLKGLMICVAGEYANRIIIPYYDREGDLVYWNGRDLGNSQLRYRGPDANMYPAAKKEEVVWMEYFPKSGSKVYLTEGEFDAMTLNECGFNAAAFGGASFNAKQFEMLRGYHLVLAFDADKAGENGIRQISDAITATKSLTGVDTLHYVRPPKQFKDWNAMYQAYDKDIVRLYVEKKEAKHQVLNVWNILKLRAKL
jgi:DNA primase